LYTMEPVDEHVRVVVRIRPVLGEMGESASQAVVWKGNPRQPDGHVRRNHAHNPCSGRTIIAYHICRVGSRRRQDCGRWCTRYIRTCSRAHFLYLSSEL
jgi:hypothetical protein